MSLNILALKELSILLVEDEERVRKETGETLNVFFCSVFTATSKQEAYEVYFDQRPDIILSDIKLQDGSGIEFVKRVRGNDHKTPIVMLTSFGDQQNLLEAANSGIDGYLIKPINLDDLTRTLLKALQRGIGKNGKVNLQENLIYDYATKEVHKDGKRVGLGTKEQRLFRLFVENSGRTLSKEEIIYNVWPLEDITESALKNVLNRLRNKVGENTIVSVRGVGWRLNLD